jgi:hypothetical protein
MFFAVKSLVRLLYFVVVSMLMNLFRSTVDVLSATLLAIYPLLVLWHANLTPGKRTVIFGSFAAGLLVIIPASDHGMRGLQGNAQRFGFSAEIEVSARHSDRNTLILRSRKQAGSGIIMCNLVVISTRCYQAIQRARHRRRIRNQARTTDTELESYTLETIPPPGHTNKTHLTSVRLSRLSAWADTDSSQLSLYSTDGNGGAGPSGTKSAKRSIRLPTLPPPTHVSSLPTTPTKSNKAEYSAIRHLETTS